MEQKNHVVIIGNGIAGVTAARHIRKHSDFAISIVSEEYPYFFSRTALMYVYMGHMKFEHTKPYEDVFWEKNNIDLVHDRAEEIDFQEKRIKLKSKGELSYDFLILATGSKPNKFGWKGQDLKGVQGLYSKQDLDLLEENTHPYGTSIANQRVKSAVIIGGGLIGVELAEMLHSRNIQVSIWVREKRIWGNVLSEEESELILGHLKEHGIQVESDTELEEILGDENGRVQRVRAKNGFEMEAQFVGLTPGVHPNIEFVKDSLLEVNRGILVDQQLRTNMDGVYAVGDCVEFREAPNGRSKIEQVWYTGRMMGEVVASNITGADESYAPGPWFNSAKFFDIEYQTYGRVPNEDSDNSRSWVWRPSRGRHLIRLASNPENNEFIGINSFGIRLKHEYFDNCLRAQKSTEEVMSNLKEAFFDPEFYPDHGSKIIEAYNEEHGTSIKYKKKRLLFF